jgi:hypothetical protein
LFKKASVVLARSQNTDVHSQIYLKLSIVNEILHCVGSITLFLFNNFILVEEDVGILSLVILFLIFFVHPILFSQSGLVQQVSGVTQRLNSIYCLNESTAWVCGGAGVILKTINGGTNWVQQSSSYTYNISDIYFIDSQTGWACGDFKFPRISFSMFQNPTNGETIGQ